MTAATTISFFHQWLLAPPANPESACAIMLHGDSASLCERLLVEITDYLNEYDDDGEGRWLAACPDLIRKISADVSHRQLLGLNDTASQSDRGETEELTILSLLGARGHVVLLAPEAAELPFELPNAFHAGVGGGWGTLGSCHLILNPKLMDRKCIALIIGDVFLEWRHCDHQRGPRTLQDIR